MTGSPMDCRMNCAACCTAPSISSAIPGMPEGKPAGVTCVNLDPVTLLCGIWGKHNYPDVCRNFKPSPDFCGAGREEGLALMSRIEELTR